MASVVKVGANLTKWFETKFVCYVLAPVLFEVFLEITTWQVGMMVNVEGTEIWPQKREVAISVGNRTHNKVRKTWSISEERYMRMHQQINISKGELACGVRHSRMDHTTHQI